MPSSRMLIMPHQHQDHHHPRHHHHHHRHHQHATYRGVLGTTTRSVNGKLIFLKSNYKYKRRVNNSNNKNNNNTNNTNITNITNAKTIEMQRIHTCVNSNCSSTNQHNVAARARAGNWEECVRAYVARTINFMLNVFMPHMPHATRACNTMHIIVNRKQHNTDDHDDGVVVVVVIAVAVATRPTPSSSATLTLTLSLSLAVPSPWLSRQNYDNMQMTLSTPCCNSHHQQHQHHCRCHHCHQTGGDGDSDGDVDGGGDNGDGVAKRQQFPSIDQPSPSSAHINAVAVAAVDDDRCDRIDDHNSDSGDNHDGDGDDDDVNGNGINTTNSIGAMPVISGVVDRRSSAAAACANRSRLLSICVTFLFMALTLFGGQSSFLHLPHVEAGACWQRSFDNGKCNEIFSMNTTKIDCCRANQEFGFTERELAPVEYFFATAIGGGVECAPCMESCRQMKCGPNKRCVKRKGRPKCICAPECGAAMRRKQKLQKLQQMLDQAYEAGTGPNNGRDGGGGGDGHGDGMGMQHDEAARQEQEHSFMGEITGTHFDLTHRRPTVNENANANANAANANADEDNRKNQNQRRSPTTTTTNTRPIGGVGDNYIRVFRMRSDDDGVTADGNGDGDGVFVDNAAILINENAQRLSVMSNVAHSMHSMAAAANAEHANNKNTPMPTTATATAAAAAASAAATTTPTTTRRLQIISNVGRQQQQKQQQQSSSRRKAMRHGNNNNNNNNPNNSNNKRKHKRPHNKRRKATLVFANIDGNNNNTHTHTNNNNNNNRIRHFHQNNERHATDYDEQHAQMQRIHKQQQQQQQQQQHILLDHQHNNNNNNSSKVLCTTHVASVAYTTNGTTAAAAPATTTTATTTTTTPTTATSTAATPVNSMSSGIHLNDHHQLQQQHQQQQQSHWLHHGSNSATSSGTTTTTTATTSRTITITPVARTTATTVTINADDGVGGAGDFDGVGVSAGVSVGKSPIDQSNIYGAVVVNGGDGGRDADNAAATTVTGSSSSGGNGNGVNFNSINFDGLIFLDGSYVKNNLHAFPNQHQHHQQRHQLQQQQQQQQHQHKHYSITQQQPSQQHHIPHPVCGTDGRTYNTECQLKKRACRTDNPKLAVAYRGHCRTSCNGVKCLNGLVCVEDHYTIPHCIACKIQCPYDEDNYGDDHDDDDSGDDQLDNDNDDDDADDQINGNVENVDEATMSDIVIDSNDGTTDNSNTNINTKNNNNNAIQHKQHHQHHHQHHHHHHHIAHHPNDNSQTTGSNKHSKRRKRKKNRNTVCGVDGKTYQSVCHINRMVCKIGRAIAVAYSGPCRADRVTCSDINCGPKHTCLVNLLTHEPRCVSCRYKCSRTRDPVAQRYEQGKICGVNNRTYNSWCEMRKDSCATGFYIDVKMPGACK